MRARLGAPVDLSRIGYDMAEVPDSKSVDSNSTTDTEAKTSRETISSPLTVVLKLDGQEIRNEIAGFRLFQPIDGHHKLEITVHTQDGVQSVSDISSELSGITRSLGKSLTLTASGYGDAVSSGTLEYVGVVTNVLVNNSVGELDSIRIIAQSPTIRMDGAKVNAFFYDQKASDIASSIVRANNITPGTMDASATVMKYCVQYRETDYDFICRLATGAGMFAFYDGAKFHIAKKGGTEKVGLVWRESLGMFSYNWGTTSTAFKSDSYQYTEKKDLNQDSESSSSRASLSNLSKISADASKQLFTAKGFIAAKQEVSDAKSLEGIVMAAKGSAMGRMIECTGQSIEFGVKVGHIVEISNMGSFNGQYQILSVTHQTSEQGRYYNTFTCTPVELAHAQFRSKRKSETYIQYAKVTDNNDPENLGRIKVALAWDPSVNIWIRMMVPYAGKDRGWLTIPEIGDEVLIAYEQGSPDLPVVLGAMYNGKDVPSADTAQDDSNVKGFSTRAGHKILFNDKDGEEDISIIAMDGTMVILSAAESSVTIETSGDITLKGNNITIKADQKITLDGSELEIKAQQNIKTEAGMNLELKGGMQCKVEGMMVEVKGTPIKLN